MRKCEDGSYTSEGFIKTLLVQVFGKQNRHDRRTERFLIGNTDHLLLHFSALQPPLSGFADYPGRGGQSDAGLKCMGPFCTKFGWQCD